MPTEVISTVLPDGSKKIDLKSGLNPLEKITASQLIEKKALKASSKNEAKVFRKICLFLADNDVSFSNKIWLETI